MPMPDPPQQSPAARMRRLQSSLQGCASCSASLVALMTAVVRPTAPRGPCVKGLVSHWRLSRDMLETVARGWKLGHEGSGLFMGTLGPSPFLFLCFPAAMRCTGLLHHSLTMTPLSPHTQRNRTQGQRPKTSETVSQGKPFLS